MKKAKAHPIQKAATGLAGGLVLVAVLLAVNVVIGNLRMRVDLTDEKLYSLSEGTIRTLQKLEAPVTLNFFFNSSNPGVPTALKNYASQVEDLLEEYRIAAKGKIRIVKLDPKPDSDAEEWARKYGLEGKPVEMFGPPIYFGLVAVAGKAEQVLSGLDPRTQQLLEYNITRMINGIAHPDKPVLGVYSSMPVLGAPTPPYPMPGQPKGQNPWIAFQDLGQDYELRQIRDLDEEAIASDIDALLVVHPKNLSETAQYAVDQFVMRGGHLIMFLDPLSYADQASTPPPRGGFQMPQTSSDAPKLLKAWGIGYDPAKVLGDVAAGTPMRTMDNKIERNPVIVTYSDSNLASDDVLTAQLEMVRAACAGVLVDETSDEIEVMSLIASSESAGTVDAMTARFGGDAVRRQIVRAGAPQSIALMLKGKFKTAFPDGPPDAEQDADGDETNAPPPVADSNALKEGNSVVLLIADVDMIFDPICVEELNFFGQKAYRPLNDNLTFFANAVESMAGSEDLIGIRSRGAFSRPFTEVDKREAAAVQKWRAKEADLEAGLREAQTQLSQLQAEKDEDQRFILSDQQRKAIESFRREEFRISQELKQVRKNLRRDIEVLGIKVKMINIALAPLLVSIAGIAYGIRRKRS